MKKIPVSLCLALIIAEMTHAQMVNNGSIVGIATNTVMSVDADMLNTGTLTNQGALSLSGNWTNVGVYDDTAVGQLFFNSAAPQNILNNGQKIENLILLNGEKILNDDLVVTGQLSLSQGILRVNEGARLTLNQCIFTLDQANYA